MSKSLQVVFDFSCPYCYITWKYFMQLQKQYDFTAEWLTWNIHPEVGPEGKNIAEVVSNFDLESRRERLNGLGAAVGVAPADRLFVPDTRLPLQGVEFAREHGQATAWCDAVFDAHFNQEKNIGDIAVLLSIGQELGLNVPELEHSLASGKYEAVLADNDRRFMAVPVEWVPTIFEGDVKILEGAFTYQQAEQVIKELLSVK